MATRTGNWNKQKNKIWLIFHLILIGGTPGNRWLASQQKILRAPGSYRQKERKSSPWSNNTWQALCLDGFQPSLQLHNRQGLPFIQGHQGRDLEACKWDAQVGSKCANDFKANTTNIYKRNQWLNRQEWAWWEQGAGGQLLPPLPASVASHTPFYPPCTCACTFLARSPTFICPESEDMVSM